MPILVDARCGRCRVAYAVGPGEEHQLAVLSGGCSLDLGPGYAGHNLRIADILHADESRQHHAARSVYFGRNIAEVLPQIGQITRSFRCPVQHSGNLPTSVIVTLQLGEIFADGDELRLRLRIALDGRHSRQKSLLVGRPLVVQQSDDTSLPVCGEDLAINKAIARRADMHERLGTELFILVADILPTFAQKGFLDG